MGPIWLGFAAVQIPRPWDYLCLIEAGADLLFAMKTARPRWEPSLVLSPSCPPRRRESQNVCVQEESPRATPGPSTASWMGQQKPGASGAEPPAGQR